MNFLYKIIEQSIYTKQFEECDLVECSPEEIKKLCDDMNSFHKNNLRTFYSSMPTNVEVIDENGKYFIVEPLSFKASNMSISNSHYEVIKDSEQGMKDKLEAINGDDSVKYKYACKEAEVLTPEQAFSKFKNRLKSLGFIVEDDKQKSVEPEVEKEF